MGGAGGLGAGFVDDGAVDEPAQTPRPAIDRRTLIKRAAAAGAIAWTAPVIVESLTSPAAAITGTPGCFRFRVSPASCVSGTTFSAIGPFCPVTTTQCSPTDDLSTPLSNYCMTVSDCSASGAVTKTFTINAGCSCTFLAATGETSFFQCEGLCLNATITGGGKVATFAVLAGAPVCTWLNWRFIVQCA